MEMTVTEAIKKLQAIEAQGHGNVPVFDGEFCSIDFVRLGIAEDSQFPKDWNMPAGVVYVQIGAYR